MKWYEGKANGVTFWFQAFDAGHAITKLNNMFPDGGYEFKRAKFAPIEISSR